MLESNTDRSYFMIGAVIVAAIIIAAVSWVFRDVLFAPTTGLVPKLLNEFFGKASSMVNGITSTTQK